MEEFRGVELAAVPVILRNAGDRGAPSRPEPGRRSPGRGSLRLRPSGGDFGAIFGRSPAGQEPGAILSNAELRVC